jgi:hypothetical protein
MIDNLKSRFDSGVIEPVDWLGDSLSRFDQYKQWASKVDIVGEYGVYTGHSTLAFLAAKPKKLYSVDITDQYLTILPELQSIAAAQGTEYQFVVADSLKTNFQVDLLFIDTYHSAEDPIGTFNHTLKELVWHREDVSKYMMLHDTNSHPPVRDAIVKFIQVYPEWSVVYEDHNGDGLMVLQK